MMFTNNNVVTLVLWTMNVALIANNFFVVNARRLGATGDVKGQEESRELLIAHDDSDLIADSVYGLDGRELIWQNLQFRHSLSSATYFAQQVGNEVQLDDYTTWSENAIWFFDSTGSAYTLNGGSYDGQARPIFTIRNEETGDCMEMDTGNSKCKSSLRYVRIGLLKYFLSRLGALNKI